MIRWKVKALNSLGPIFAVSGDREEKKYGKTPNAFIFSLNNSEQTRAFKSMVRNSEKATFNHIFLGPTFGNNDIRIDRHPDKPKDKTSSVANFGNDYFLPSNVTIQNPQTILAGVKNFRPDELEVFYLTKEPCRQTKVSPPWNYVYLRRLDVIFCAFQLVVKEWTPLYKILNPFAIQKKLSCKPHYINQ